MTNKINNWLFGIVLAVAAIGSAASWAIGPQRGMDHDPGRMMSHMADQLDLTEEQQAEVKSLLASSRESNAGAHQRLMELRKGMMEMRADFDADKARDISDEIGDLTGQLVYQASTTWAGVYRLLDAEQRTELDELIKKREARGSKWRRDGGQAGD